MILASAVAVLVGAAGVAAVTTMDQPERAVSVADSPSTAGDASPTEGLLPRYLLDAGGGWGLWSVEDYPLLDSEGSFTLVAYRWPTAGDDQVLWIALRRTRERIVVEATDDDGEPCDDRDFVVGDRTGYLRSDGVNSAFVWAPEDHVFATVSGYSVLDHELVAIAQSLVPRPEAEWSAAIANAPSHFRITSAAATGASWQYAWDGQYGLEEQMLPDPQLELTSVPGNSEVGEPVWVFTFCLPS